MNEAATATQKVDNSIGGTEILAMTAPGKAYGTSEKSETMVVNAYKAITLISQLNIPIVSKLSGKNNILSKGTKIKLISINAAAPISRLLTPPL